MFGLATVFAETITIDLDGITSSKGNTGITMNMTITTDVGETWFMVYEDGLLVNTTELVMTYPTFSNLTDNSGIDESEESNFDVMVADSNGTVYLNINNSNYSATDLGNDNYEVDLNLSVGDYQYYWFSYGNDSYEEFDSSEVKNFSVVATFPISGLVSYYKLDDSGAIIIDSHGSNNGTNIGTTNASGKIINSRSFDGSADGIDVTGSSLDITSAVTMSAWVKADTISSLDKIVSKMGSTDGHSLWSLGLYDGRINIKANHVSGTSDVFSGTYLSTGVWYHVVGIINGTGMRIYLNGVDDGFLANTNALVTTSIQKMTIGYEEPVVVGDRYFFDGLIDEVGIWNRSLTADEIEYLYNSGSGLAYS